MKKKFTLKTILVFSVFFLITQIINAQTSTPPSTGDGSSGNPYQVATLDNLYWLSQTDSVWTSGHYFIQTADIDAGDTKNWDSNHGFSPIGTSSNYFYGSYNGQTHTIDSLFINRSSLTGVGLLGWIGSAATIENLGLLNVDITGSGAVSALVGALNGNTSDTCSINNCYATGAVAADLIVGGLFGGFIDGSTKIISSYSTCSVIVLSGGNVGGLVGLISNCIILNSYATGSVNSSGDYTGGLVGYMGSGGTITKSWSSGSVNSSGDYTGGLVGYIHEVNVSNAYATGSVSGNDAVGGLAGYTYLQDTLSNCYSIGLVTGNSNTGGLVGYSYNSTNVVNNSFWDKESSNQTTSAGGTGKTTAEMKTQATFTDAGWDFTYETANGTNDIWRINSSNNNGYPFLSWQVPHTFTPSGSGSSSDPYQITTLDNLYWLSRTDSVWTSGHYFIQTADIDAGATSGWDTGSGFSPIGDYSTSIYFSGSYDGQNHTIDNLYINRPSTDYIGLISVLYTDGIIKNLGLLNVNITGFDNMGGLVGIAVDSISNCYSTGMVSGNDGVGGLSGSGNYINNCYSTCTVSGNDNVGGLTGNSGIASNCYSTGTVTGSDYVGGLAGSSSGTASNCYSTGTVTGNDRVGGLVGYNSGTVSYCYSTGGVVTGNSYIGGLVGHNISTGSVNDCYSIDSVSGSTNIGGLVGLNSPDCTITKSHSAGFVSGSGDYIGGLVGVNFKGTVSYCYSAGCMVTGNTYVGGLVGDNFTIGSIIKDCYSINSVSGSAYIGGLVGRNNVGGTVNRSYSAGFVSGSGGNIGGLAGNNNSATINNSFWDTQTSGQSTSDGGTGKTTVQMKTQSTFTDAGWDFTNVWQIVGGDGANYPDLIDNSNSALPVELTSFTASVNENTVTLMWKTETEVNNYGFEIQKSEVSSQNIEFKSVGFVDGHGNSNSPKEYSFTDEKITTGAYKYRLKQIDNDGTFEYSDVVEVSYGAPVKFALEQNYPNPFNPATNIRWQSPVAGRQTLKVYDILGNEVATLVDENRPAGSYEVEFNAVNLSSGVYFYRLTAGNNVAIKKLILIK